MLNCLKVYLIWNELVYVYVKNIVFNVKMNSLNLIRKVFIGFFDCNWILIVFDMIVD